MKAFLATMLGVLLVGVCCVVHSNTRLRTADELAAAARAGNHEPLNRAFRDGKTRQRAEAVEAALEVQDTQAMRILHDTARDRELPLKMLLLRRLSTLPADKALTLIRAFLEDTEPGIVRDAIDALERITRETYGYDPQAPLETRRKATLQCQQAIADKLAR